MALTPISLSAGTTAVLTGAGSGFGLALARLLAARGVNLALADVQVDALDAGAAECRALGARVLALHTDVSKAGEVDALAAATQAAFGAPHLVFNNAGVGLGGLIWEHSLADWQWVLGVNLMGVAHGVRAFTPLMLAAARADAGYAGHIVNTASMAGLVSMPNLGVYNVSKHAVVALSETLFQDLGLVTTQVGASVLCPYFVPTGIHRSGRNRPADAAPAAPLTASQQIAQASMDKAVNAGRVSAEDVAARVVEAVEARQFYIASHPQALGAVQSRLDDIMAQRNPGDPFQDRPQIGAMLRAALQGGADGTR